MSTDTMDKTTPAEQTVEALTAKAGEWARERAAALAELERLEAGAGGDLLDDPAAAESLAARVAALRARADLAGRAVTEARARAHAARVEIKRAEAAALDPEIDKARRALDVHQAKRERLQKALEDFTGHGWRPIPDSEVYGVGVSYTRDTRPDELLRYELEQLQNEQQALQADADALADDPDWQPPSERWQAHVREEWDKAVAGHRQAAHDLAQTRREITDTAAAVKHDLDDLSYAPPWLEKLRERVAELEEQLQGFHEDVKHFRGQDLDLSDDEVSALKVELGLEDA